MFNDAIFQHLTKLDPSRIAATYPYGSRVYGTYSHSSDYDYIVVYDGDESIDGQQFDSHSGDLSIHTYSVEKWKTQLLLQKIFAIECFSLDDSVFEYDLDISKLRIEISSKASNSWVKAKKKILVEDEYYLAIKSLFHSFRIPIFGLQIVEHGKVVDFTAANHLWGEMKDMVYTKPTWEELYERYKKQHNAIMTEFRQQTILESDK